MKERAARCLLVLLIMSMTLVLAGCSGGTPAAGQPVAGKSESIPALLSDEPVVADGRVIPTQAAMLSFYTSGVVSEVLVTEGDLVQAGQVLARLRGNQPLQASLAAAELEVLLAEQERIRLQENSQLEKAQAELAVAAAQQELEKVEKRLLSREYQRGSPDQVDIARANFVLAEDGVTDAAHLYDQVDDRAEDDSDRAHALSQLAVARQKRDQALGNLNYLLSKPNPFDVAQIGAEVAVARARFEAAELLLASLKSGPPADQVALLDAKLKNAQSQLAAAQAGLLDLDLKAPFAGVVGALEITGGEFVSPGAAVARLSDQSSWLVETTDLTELNIARIKPGMPAVIRFDALTGYEVIARVVSIDSFGENRQGDIAYAVRLKLDQADVRLRWNMTATVTFIEKLEE